MSEQMKLGGLPYWFEDGKHIVKCGRWVIEYNPAKGIYAWSNYIDRVNSGHQIPVEVVDGEPYYPFGISHHMPVYAKQAMDFLVKSVDAQKTGSL